MNRIVQSTLTLTQATSLQASNGPEVTITFAINNRDYQDYYIEGELVKIPRCVILVAYLIFKRDERHFDFNNLEMQFDDAMHYCYLKGMIDTYRGPRFPYGRVKR